MNEIKGLFNTAKVFTDVIEDSSVELIKNLCDNSNYMNCQIRIMPDVHTGVSVCIGTTISSIDNARINPGTVGLDIGCSVIAIPILEDDIDFINLDRFIRKKIPSGFDIRSTPHDYADLIDLTKLYCKDAINIDRALKSIGTLGGGNHFIEIDKGKDCFYLIIHTGSRNLGLQVANYYRDSAYNDNPGSWDKPDDAELYGHLKDEYLHDIDIIQRYAKLNRCAIALDILESAGFKYDIDNAITSVHNYIDLDRMILRKGAVSAEKDEKLIIPINMRDGCLICKGKGNKDWNYSAPHGAGRLMSRNEAKKTLSLDQFKEEMKGIYSTSVNEYTLDEAPMAYKGMDNLINNIGETADIIEITHPVYNFKAAKRTR